MNNIQLYKCFRRELDNMWIPLALEELEVKEINYRGRTIGILCTCNNYIDCLYVSPTYRRRGFGKRAVLQWLKSKGYTEVTLDIINNNYPAREFWGGIFTLEPVSADSVCISYKGRLK